MDPGTALPKAKLIIPSVSFFPRDRLSHRGANPNAALLMTGWVATKGVRYLRTGRESIFHPESELGAHIKKMGRPLKVADWDTAIRTEELMRKILEVWGFPKPEKKGG
jgi:hypothetical protein